MEICDVSIKSVTSWVLVVSCSLLSSEVIKEEGDFAFWVVSEFGGFLFGNWGSFIEAPAVIFLFCFYCSVAVRPLYANLLPCSAERFDAFEAKKDLFWSRVLWRISYKTDPFTFVVLERNLIFPP
ncbi:hypothetical protein Ancab_021052 [Ancistrocladus abbreviatus]